LTVPKREGVRPSDPGKNAKKKKWLKGFVWFLGRKWGLSSAATSRTGKVSYMTIKTLSKRKKWRKHPTEE